MHKINIISKKNVLSACMVLLTACWLTGCGSKEYLSDIKPEKYVTLGQYKGIEVTENEPAVAEEYVENYIEYALSMHSELSEVTDRAIIQGDTVSIDYAGYRDGVAFEGGTGSIEDLVIGSGRFIPGFEDGLIGAMLGDELSLNLTFPDNYGNGLSGAEVVFEVTVNGIWETILPDYDDAFVKSIGLEGVNTTEEYHDYIYSLFYEDAVDTYNQAIQQDVVESAMANCIFKDPPEEMTARFYTIIVNDMTSMAAAYGMDLNSYMGNYYGMSRDSYQEAFEKQSVELAQQYIMYQAIADAEGLNPSEEEIAQAKAESMGLYGIEDEEEFDELMDGKTFREYVMADRVIQFLVDNAEVYNVAAIVD